MSGFFFVSFKCFASKNKFNSLALPQWQNVANREVGAFPLELGHRRPVQQGKILSSEWLGPWDSCEKCEGMDMLAALYPQSLS